MRQNEMFPIILIWLIKVDHFVAQQIDVGPKSLLCNMGFALIQKIGSFQLATPPLPPPPIRTQSYLAEI